MILPYTSNRAITRVKDPIPAPTHCPYCEGEVELQNNSIIYGREYGKWPYVYRCSDCDAYVGLHPETAIPLGTLADAKLRQARRSGKKTFHEMQVRLQQSRNEVYQWLATALEIPQEECHWGMFDLDMCVKATQLCREEFL